MNRTIAIATVGAMLAAAPLPSSGAPLAAIAHIKGSDFKGGGAEVFGGTMHEMGGVNYVYARSNGERSRMRAAFPLEALPKSELFLHVHGRDDDSPEVCPITISLNGKTLLEGPSGFPHDKWAWKAYVIPAGVLKQGTNELVFACTADTGKLGVPPWFMLAECRIGGRELPARPLPRIEDNFIVRLPAEKRPLPEPLSPEHAEPGFKIRGTKGWNWTVEQYLAEIPVLAEYKMNFLMNCYLSMFDDKQAWHSGQANRWWEPLGAEKKAGYEKVVQSCREHKVQFCFAMNPNLVSSRPLKYDSAKDVDDLWQHYAWMAGLGVEWFSICLDDISQGIDAAGQARVVNEITRRLREKNPAAKMIFCPTYYWATGEPPKEREYLAIVAKELDPDVYCFWTGDGVVGGITRKAAEIYRQRIGHRLIIWDNYPVNDGASTLHLGPVMKRDRDLCAVTDGYMANPLYPQNEINRLPLLTEADYAYNPWAYDPGRSIGQAILHLGKTSEQQQVLADLVELYPGMLLTGQGTGWNPVLSRFNEITATPHAHVLAKAWLQHVQQIADRMDRAFPDEFRDAGKTLKADVTRLKNAFKDRYSHAE